MILKKLIIAYCFLTSYAYGQARSSIGFSFGINKTFDKYDHDSHFGVGLLGNLRIIDRVAVEPAIALKEVNNFVTARLSAKYYITNNLFVTGGPFFWVGRDLYNNFGFTSSAGYRIISTVHSNLELSLHGDFAEYIFNSVPVAGVRLTYNFQFQNLPDK